MSIIEPTKVPGEYVMELEPHYQFPHPHIPGFTVTEIRYTAEGYRLQGLQTLNAPRTPPSEPLTPAQRMHLAPLPPEMRVPSSTFHRHNRETLAAYEKALQRTPAALPPSLAPSLPDQNVLLPSEVQAARAELGIRFPQTGRPRSTPRGRA